MSIMSEMDSVFKCVACGFFGVTVLADFCCHALWYDSMMKFSTEISLVNALQYHVYHR